MSRIGFWLLGGLAGSIQFWALQMLAGGGTITDFMGRQIVVAGGYPAPLAGLLGWTVHLGVSLSYALLVALVVLALRPAPFAIGAAAALVAALALGWVTAIIAPPAISITISMLGRQGWPRELFPLNTELGLPLWNHLLFFLVNWLIQAVGPRAVVRP